MPKRDLHELGVTGHVEGRLRFSPYIKDVMVIGGKDKDLVSAIININFVTVGKWAERNRLGSLVHIFRGQAKVQPFDDIRERCGCKSVAQKKFDGFDIVACGAFMCFDGARIGGRKVRD
jgi:hypothetical protein